MSKLLNELLGAKGTDQPQGFVFFNDDQPEGYTSQAEFVDSLKRQKRSDKAFRVDHTKSMFDNMSLNRKLMAEPSISSDEGQEIIWVRFGYGNLRQNLQILNECRMFDFIMDYATGKVRNVPNFETLIGSIKEV